MSHRMTAPALLPLHEDGDILDGALITVAASEDEDIDNGLPKKKETHRGGQKYRLLKRGPDCSSDVVTGSDRSLLHGSAFGDAAGGSPRAEVNMTCSKAPSLSSQEKTALSTR
jgi:hypothetical protein